MSKWTVLKLLVIAISLYFSYTLTRSLIELYQARDRVTNQEKMLAEAKSKNEQLKNRLEEVRSLDYLEKEARESLNMQLPGEVVVILDGVKNEKRKIDQRKDRELPNWRRWMELVF